MMKHLLLASLVGVSCFSGDLNANPYHSLRHHAIAFGDALENVNLPLVGKLTNLLPFAMVAAAFKKCPGQTMLVLSGLLVYALMQNDSFCALLRQYGFMGQSNNQINALDDETLFVFEGEDAEDAFEEAEVEDEMLEVDLLSDDNLDRNTTRRPAKSRFL